MDNAKLRMFMALAETLHFHKASERCHVSPSTISRSISQLEQSLQTQLFVRNNRSVTMTDDGHQLLKYARDTLQHWDTLKAKFQAHANELRGALSFYCSVTASYSFLYDMLVDFRKRHALVEIRLHTGDPAQAIDRVLSGSEDISIAAKLDVMPQGVQFKRMRLSPLVLIKPARANATFDTTTASHTFWQQVPFILSEQGVTRQRINIWFRNNQITPNIYAQVAGHEAVVSMVSLGFGLGLIPKIVLDNSPLADKVVPFQVQPKFKPYEVGLCVLEKRLKNPLVQAFWEQMRTHSASDA